MDTMISLQCSSSESIAKELTEFLRSQGYSAWICIEMTGGVTFREEIVVNASGSKCMIALMNTRWAESKECRYEFNIALRGQLTKGYPHIIPIVLESFDFNSYPLITGVMANTNAIFYNAKNPKETWNLIAKSLSSIIKTKGANLPTPLTVPVAAPNQVPVKGANPLPKNISEWTCDHVGQWFQSLNLPYSSKDMFERNWVDGAMLLELKEEEMIESLKLTCLQAKRLTREIGKLNIQKPTSSRIQDLTSRFGFKTGIWEGHYKYDGDKRDNMSMDVTMVAGIVAGYGTDPVGDFLVQGKYDDSSLSIEWDKFYVGQHVVYYKGFLCNGKTIKGSWEIPGDWAGTFELTYKPI